jgi:hypothetical protein
MASTATFSAATKLAWPARGVIIPDRLGAPETTTIVQPHKFISAIMRAAQRRAANCVPLRQITHAFNCRDRIPTPLMQTNGRSGSIPEARDHLVRRLQIGTAYQAAFARRRSAVGHSSAPLFAGIQHGRAAFGRYYCASTGVVGRSSTFPINPRLEVIEPIDDAATEVPVGWAGAVSPVPLERTIGQAK